MGVDGQFLNMGYVQLGVGQGEIETTIRQVDLGLNLDYLEVK